MDILDYVQRVSGRYVVSDEVLRDAKVDIEAYVYKQLAYAMGGELERYMTTSTEYDLYMNTHEFRSVAYVVPDLKALKAAVQMAIHEAYIEGQKSAHQWEPPASRNPDDLR